VRRDSVISPRVDTSVRIRQASFEDCDQIAAVELRNGLVTRAPEDWVALWKDNPAYRPCAAWWPIGWVLETPQSEIVGSFCSLPSAYRFRGRDLLAATGVGWVVDPRYRAYSIWLLREFLRQQRVDLLLSTTTSREAEAVLRFFHWSTVPVGEWQKSAFWITGYSSFLNAALQRKSLSLPAAIRSPVAASWSRLDQLRHGACNHGRSGLEVAFCSEFDDRFEKLWQTLERQNPHILLAVRTRETLAFHFQSSLVQKKLWIVAASKHSDLVGYAIFDRVDRAATGLRCIRLVDFCALEAPADVLRSTLAVALEQCKHEDLDMLEVVGCWLDRPELVEVAAPYRRTMASCLFYYFAPHQQLREALQAPGVWRPSSFDGDASLGTWGGHTRILE
jgi:hypothetical protein